MTFWSRVFPLSACLLLVGVAACNKGPSAPSGQAKPEVSDTVAAAVPDAKEFAPASELHALHFDFDRSQLRASELGRVDQTARWLKTRPLVMLQIAGHSDERGTDAYNLALGERRAESIKNALTKRGIDGNRLLTISYGESRPLCAEHAEGCWAKNRRAEFRVKPQQ